MIDVIRPIAAPAYAIPNAAKAHGWPDTMQNRPSATNKPPAEARISLSPIVLSVV